MLPNNSVQLFTFASSLRSRKRKASSESGAVHDTRSANPPPSMSKLTPCSRSVSAMPSPLMSTTTGDLITSPSHLQVSQLKSVHELMSWVPTLVHLPLRGEGGVGFAP